MRLKVAVVGLLLAASGVAVATDPAPDRGGAPTEPVAPPRDIRQELTDGVVVNWSWLRLEVVRSATGHGVGSTQEAVEQEVRRRIGPSLLAGARVVPVTSDRTYADLEATPSLREPLQSRLELWNVTEARYFASGKVELVAELPLHELLKPWTLSVAQTAPKDIVGEHTGLIVDARETGVRPAFAPRVLSSDGTVLYDGTLWEQIAVERAPAVYVADESHPATARAGALPMRVRAETARGSDLVLSAQDSARFVADGRQAFVLAGGTLVIVVDP